MDNQKQYEANEAKRVWGKLQEIEKDVCVGDMRGTVRELLELEPLAVVARFDRTVRWGLNGDYGYGEMRLYEEGLRELRECGAVRDSRKWEQVRKRVRISWFMYACAFEHQLKRYYGAKLWKGLRPEAQAGVDERFNEIIEEELKKGEE